MLCSGRDYLEVSVLDIPIESADRETAKLQMTTQAFGGCAEVWYILVGQSISGCKSLQ